MNTKEFYLKQNEKQKELSKQIYTLQQKSQDSSSVLTIHLYYNNKRVGIFGISIPEHLLDGYTIFQNLILQMVKINVENELAEYMSDEEFEQMYKLEILTTEEYQKLLNTNYKTCHKNTIDEYAKLKDEQNEVNFSGWLFYLIIRYKNMKEQYYMNIPQVGIDEYEFNTDNKFYLNLICLGIDKFCEKYETPHKEAYECVYEYNFIYEKTVKPLYINNKKFTLK